MHAKHAKKDNAMNLTIHAATQALERALDETIGEGRFADAGDKLISNFKRACSQADELQDETVRATRSAARSTDRAIRRHPYSAIGAVALAAIIAGVLVARR
jgi:ElaB/YqjD/DUF883 family membrane-anchored ribosome-binding protein